jgi:hypothetical protein
MAELTGHHTDAAECRVLADDIRPSANDTSCNETLGRFTANGAGPGCVTGPHRPSRSTRASSPTTVAPT